ncbi:DUF6517 family protein [Natrialba hulunbeirensis]|nr:DUF6517 family protein [Natrialba hulunbeirensis]
MADSSPNRDSHSPSDGVTHDSPRAHDERAPPTQTESSAQTATHSSANLPSTSTSSRRSLLAAGATASLALTAGCLDFALGNGPLEFSAGRVAPHDDALGQTGYAEESVEEQALEESVDVGAGIEREIRAGFWQSTYVKDVELAPIGEEEAALFTALSMPAVEILGRSFNPLEDLGNHDLVERLLEEVDSEAGQIEDIEHKESFGLEILGDGRDVDTFVGQSTFDGEEIEIELTLTSFVNEDDLLVLLGTHPEMLAEESANIEELLESVEHPV